MAKGVPQKRGLCPVGAIYKVDRKEEKHLLAVVGGFDEAPRTTDVGRVTPASDSPSPPPSIFFVLKNFRRERGRGRVVVKWSSYLNG